LVAQSECAPLKEVAAMRGGTISIGQWYRREDTRELFQVVDWETRAGAVRIQMFDGSLDEIDEDTWRALCPP